MKLTVQKVFDAVPVLQEIGKAKLPTKGSYRVGRLLLKLEPEYMLIAKKRDDAIIAYDYKAEGAEVNSVPPDKAAEWLDKWKELSSEELNVEVEPIPLAQLDLGDAVESAVSAQQFVALGDLVQE